MTNDELDNLMERAGLKFGHPFGRSQIYTLVMLAYETPDRVILESVELSKELALLNKELATSLVHYKSGLESAVQDIAKYKALCDQLGTALDGHCAPLPGYEQEHIDALTAWREMK